MVMIGIADDLSSAESAQVDSTVSGQDFACNCVRYHLGIDVVYCCPQVMETGESGRPGRLGLLGHWAAVARDRLKGIGLPSDARKDSEDSEGEQGQQTLRAGTLTGLLTGRSTAGGNALPMDAHVGQPGSSMEGLVGSSGTLSRAQGEASSDFVFSAGQNDKGIEMQSGRGADARVVDRRSQDRGPGQKLRDRELSFGDWQFRRPTGNG